MEQQNSKASTADMSSAWKLASPAEVAKMEKIISQITVARPTMRERFTTAAKKMLGMKTPIEGAMARLQEAEKELVQAGITPDRWRLPQISPVRNKPGS